MISEHEEGIVLYNFYPHKGKIVVLTKSLGKVHVISPYAINRIRPGMHIMCTLHHFNESTYQTLHIDILQVPNLKSIHDLYWLHHIFEICYYMLPLASPCQEIFDHLTHTWALLSNNHINPLCHMIFKKYVVARLLFLLGYYPHNEQFSSLFIDFAELRTVKSLQVYLAKLNAKHKTTIDAWIMECLQNHPSYAQFKTPRFIYRNK
jgi:hypothetical protein